MGFGNGTFLAVGDHGTLVTSEDGTNWMRHNSGVPQRLGAVVFMNDNFVVGGDQGVIVQSAGFTAPVLTVRSHPAGAGLDLGFTGLLGRHYRVQRSTNLPTWTDWTTFDGPKPSTNWTDPFGPARVFYRVISP